MPMPDRGGSTQGARLDQSHSAAEGGCIVRTRSYIDRIAPGMKVMPNLSDQQVANIVFNETRSLSGPAIAEARINVAHAIINAGASSHRFPVMASAVARPAPAEKAILFDCVTAVSTARRNVMSGTDPTDGADHFNFRKNAFAGAFNGLTLKTSVGPLENSFPTRELPARGIYANTYK